MRNKQVQVWVDADLLAKARELFVDEVESVLKRRLRDAEAVRRAMKEGISRRMHTK